MKPAVALAGAAVLMVAGAVALGVAADLTGTADRAQSAAPALPTRPAPTGPVGPDATTPTVAPAVDAIAPAAIPTATATAADAGANRATSTCTRFDAFLAKNHAGTSTVIDAVEFLSMLQLADFANEPVRSAAAALAATTSNEASTQADTQVKTDALKSACADTGVAVR